MALEVAASRSKKGSSDEAGPCELLTGVATKQAVRREQARLLDDHREEQTRRRLEDLAERHAVSTCALLWPDHMVPLVCPTGVPVSCCT